MSSTSLFNRIVKTNILLYQTDGQGRDGYIQYNNGGFWKENIKQIYPKERFDRPLFRVFHSLVKKPAIWTYHSDGSGRDNYICYNDGGLIKNFIPLSSSEKNLLKILREDKKDKAEKQKQNIILSKDEKLYLKRMKQVEKDIVNRLYNESIINNKKGNTRNRNCFKKTLCKSSSQIIGRQELKPIKYTIDCSSDILNKNDSSNCKDNNNNNDSLININKDIIKFENLKTRNKNPLYYKKEYITTADHQLIKHPKVKCSLEDVTNIN